jgi:hypothetical protein
MGTAYVNTGSGGGAGGAGEMGGGVKDVALSITCYKQTQTQSN